MVTTTQPSSSTFTQCAGTFPELVARLDRQGVPEEWAAAEPALAGISSVSRLRDLTAIGCDRDQAHGIIAALVRLASLDGSHDQRAALMVVHLLRPAIMKRARAARVDTDEAVRTLVAELALVIATFPHHRVSPTPSRLVWDAWHQAWAGGLSQMVADGRHTADIADIEQMLIADESVNASVELVDLLVDAARTGVLTTGDAALLALVAHHGGHGNDAIGRTAAALGISPATARRRRARAINALIEHNRKLTAVG